MKSIAAAIVLTASCLWGGAAACAEDVFQSQVRPTEPLSPEDERLQLQVPDGFQVTLFASEPQIQKPLNMAFDADGQLWVTGSNHYPFPAADGEGRDSVRVLKDTDGDGAADQVQVFADNLNIPIGLCPYQDGVIVFSIPNILFLRDTDHDGSADTSEVLYGPFDTSRDTHGMNNAFRAGYDGWIYACHGFNNQSTVAGTDGHEVRLHSGNVYRFRPDGSRIEHFTWGQVNPFGMTIDANGDLFTSDCHTKPVTLLIRGGYYESFGRPHDGLGFVPPVMDHLHGSTAIDGLCQYQHRVFPEDYHDDLFVGNVMTSRVHRNSIVRQGASLRMQEEADFLISQDPWFRPVDIQVGPDGALYVADFYNRIIGHYEVPLDHPGRDRHRGRIWRIAATSAQQVSDQTAEPGPLSSADTAQLIQALSHPAKGIRQHAADQLVQRVGQPAVADLQSALTAALDRSDQTAVPQLLWSLVRLQSMADAALQQVWSAGDQRTRVHVMKVCSELPVSDVHAGLIEQGLQDPSALVQRAAADAAAQHPRVDLLKKVINALAVCPEHDVHLRHGLRIALRDQLTDAATVEWFVSAEQPQTAVRLVADILPGLQTAGASALALAALRSGQLPQAQTPQLLQHAAAMATAESAADLIQVARQLPAEQRDLQAAVWRSLADGFRSAQKPAPAEFRAWGLELASRILATSDIDQVHWGQYAVDGQPAADWGFERRNRADVSGEQLRFLSSLPAGERSTGILRSRPFVLPFSLRLQLCGHLGFPEDPPLPGNRVILRDFKSGAELASALPPRNDTAAAIEMSLPGLAGQIGYLEVVDGIDLSAYAWLGISQVTPRVVDTNAFDKGATARQLETAVLILLDELQSGQPLQSSYVEQLNEIAEAIQLDGSVRALAAEALLRHHGVAELEGAARLLKSGTLPRPADRLICEYATRSNPQLRELTPQQVLNHVFAELAPELRQQLVQTLAAESTSAQLLVSLMEAGVPSAQVLRDVRLAQLVSSHSPELAARVQQLTSRLPPAGEDAEQLINQVVRRLRLGEGQAAAGEALFRKHCVACHRRGGDGGVAGPQLDGVATRGPARLLEDILKPNANVDVAFRTSIVVLQDGRTLSGIVRETPDGLNLTVLDAEGKPQTVGRSDVEEVIAGNVSLMPDNVASLLSEQDLVNLAHWLMQ